MSRDGASPCASDLPIRSRGFPLSSGERAGVRGKPAIPPLNAFLLLPALEEGPKGRMALSHSRIVSSPRLFSKSLTQSRASDSLPWAVAA